MVRVLVAIASYGSGNDCYLSRLLSEYRSMRYELHIVILSNTQKQLGRDIEVLLGTLTKDPRSLPFGHKALFAERLEQYDLFIYSEDDTLITEQNIDAFLRVTSLLPQDEIAGFLRSETDSAGQIYISTVHGHFHWHQDSIHSRANHVFAQFTNSHSGCFLLTREQLRRAIDSGGFLVGPHEGRYQLLETAATDPYTQCGFKKVICLSDLGNFIVPHLPNKYIGTMGIRKEKFQMLVDAMINQRLVESDTSELLEAETRLPLSMWSKNYYEPCQDEALSLVPDTCRSVLSIGCGWGVTESALVKKGLAVVAVPLDRIIAACVDDKRIKMVHGDLMSAREQLAEERFDCILFSNILHLASDPVTILQRFVELLSPNGLAIVIVPNCTRMKIRCLQFLRHPRYRKLGHETSGVHFIGYRQVRHWLRQSRVQVHRVIPILPSRLAGLQWLVGTFGWKLFATQLVIGGRPISYRPSSRPKRTWKSRVLQTLYGTAAYSNERPQW